MNPFRLTSRNGLIFPITLFATIAIVLLVINHLTFTSVSSTTSTNIKYIGPASSGANFPAIEATPTEVAPEVKAQADAVQEVLINVYQRADPAVVNVEVSVDNSDDIDANGSGFIIDLDGHIVTNNHVIENAKEINVTFYDGATAPAKLIGRDDFSDLAVIKVNVPQDRLVALTFADSSKLRVGQRVVAIGNPFGLLSSMTTGVVSATGRTLSARNLQYRNPSIIQVDAQINPGNSGGPLLDMNGHVIGVNSAISTETGTFQGVGFAVPSNTVKRVVPQLIQKGTAEYAWLGITSSGGREGINVAALADRLNLPVKSGVLVSDVLPGSPAEAAGLKGGTETQVIKGIRVTVGGDIITAVNGIQLRDMDQLLAYLVADAAPGDKITLTVVRGTETLQIEVTLRARPPGQN
jgi:2-alkenal reductase